MPPKISILLPTYNGASFLRQQIQSIQSQTERSWELLICDDGSRDHTPAIIEEFACTDSRIRILPSIGNKSQKRRLIELLASSSSDLIAVSDQDDIWAPDKLSLLTEAIVNYDLAFGSSRLINEDGNQLGYTLLDSLMPLPKQNDRLIYLFKPTVSGHAMLVRRNMITDMSLRRGAHFDWLVSLDCAFRAGTVYVKSAVTDHRMHALNQNNGFARHGHSVEQHLSKKSVKKYLFGITEDRLNFLAACEHLSDSMVVSREVSSSFYQAQKLIRRAWYKGNRPRMNYASLYVELEKLIAPFAGSDHDLAYARHALKMLTMSPFLPARLAVFARPNHGHGAATNLVVRS